MFKRRKKKEKKQEPEYSVATTPPVSFDRSLVKDNTFNLILQAESIDDVESIVPYAMFDLFERSRELFAKALVEQMTAEDKINYRKVYRRLDELKRESKEHRQETSEGFKNMHKMYKTLDKKIEESMETNSNRSFSQSSSRSYPRSPRGLGRGSRDQLENPVYILLEKADNAGLIGDHKLELKIYNDILKIDPDNYHAWFGKGTLYNFHLKNLKKSLKCYKKSYECDSKGGLRTESIRCIIDILEKLGDSKELEKFKEQIRKESLEG